MKLNTAVEMSEPEGGEEKEGTGLNRVKLDNQLVLIARNQPPGATRDGGLDPSGAPSSSTYV